MLHPPKGDGAVLHPSKEKERRSGAPSCGKANECPSSTRLVAHPASRYNDRHGRPSRLHSADRGPRMTPQQFIAKWQRVNLSERSACQQHFLDLCELLGQPKPAEADPDGAWYTFEKGVHEDRRRRRLGRRLDARPLRLGVQGQAQETSTPPTANCCSTARPWRTRRCWSSATWTASRSTPTSPARPSRSTPSTWPAWPSRPTSTSSASCSPTPRPCGPASPARRSPTRPPSGSASWPTACASKGIEPLRAAHFLMKLMFCMFAEDIGLLPPKLFAQAAGDGQGATRPASPGGWKACSRPWPRAATSAPTKSPGSTAACSPTPT